MLQHHSFARLSLIGILVALLTIAAAGPAFASTGQNGDQVCTGKNLTVSSGNTVRNVLAFGCNVTIENGATITNDVTDFGGNVLNQGTVDGSIIAFGGNITVASTGVVNGNLSTVGGNAVQEPGATVRGNVRGGTNFTPPTAPPTPFFSRVFSTTFDLFRGIVTAIAFAALGALVVIFAPEPTRRVGEAVQNRPWGTAGVGCLTLIVAPILALLLIITVIGIPIALVVGFAAIVGWVFGWIALGYLAGEKILQALKARDIVPVIAVVVGVLVLMVIGLVPVIGWLISFLVGLAGIGAVVLTRFGTRAYPTVPTMMMTPALGASAPGTFTPSSVDLAAWQAKAQAQAEQAHSSEMTPPPASPPTPETPPASEPPTSESGGETIPGA